MTIDAARSRPARVLIQRATLGTALVVALGACGFVNSGDDDSTEEGGSGGSLTAYVNTEQNTGLAPLIEAYEEETGGTVDISSATTDELNQQLRVQLTSGTAADLIRVSPGTPARSRSGCWAARAS